MRCIHQPRGCRAAPAGPSRHVHLVRKRRCRDLRRRRYPPGTLAWRLLPLALLAAWGIRRVYADARAGGAVALEFLKNAKPDGLTVGMINVAAAANESIIKGTIMARHAKPSVHGVNCTMRGAREALVVIKICMPINPLQ